MCCQSKAARKKNREIANMKKQSEIHELNKQIHHYRTEITARIEQSKRKKYYEGQMMQNSRRHRESQSHDPSGRLGNSIDFRNEDDNNQNW